MLRVIPAENRAVVQGVNIARRHHEQTAGQEGGIISKEMPIHISNLALRDPKDGKPTRVGYKCSRRQEGPVRQALRRSHRWLTRKKQRSGQEGKKPRQSRGQEGREEDARSRRQEAEAKAEVADTLPADYVPRLASTMTRLCARS